MARLKTKGETIGIQLPLSVDAWVRARAEARGMSPGAYLTEQLVKNYERATGKVGPEVVSNIRTPVERRASREAHPSSKAPDDCEHKNKRIISGGLALCSDCGMLRQADGKWVVR